MAAALRGTATATCSAPPTSGDGARADDRDDRAPLLAPLVTDEGGAELRQRGTSTSCSIVLVVRVAQVPDNSGWRKHPNSSFGTMRGSKELPIVRLATVGSRRLCWRRWRILWRRP